MPCNNIVLDESRNYFRSDNIGRTAIPDLSAFLPKYCLVAHFIIGSVSKEPADWI